MTCEWYWWKLRGIAGACGLSERTLRRLCQKGRVRIPKYKGAYVFPKKQIEGLKLRLERVRKM